MSSGDADDSQGRRRGPSVSSSGPFLEPTTIRDRSSEPTFEPTVKKSLDPLIGATLGEYRVIEPLGAGAMGNVYRGEQPLIGRPVAIKVLKRELANDPQHARRFLEEARAVSAARHPGIIDVFGFGETPAGEPYLVMELLEGEGLDEVLAERGKLPPDEALALLVPMLTALSAAHSAGVIHRDLKPANVFVVRLADGTTFPKLLDFGLARRGAVGERIRQTSVGGTPLYIAPEQVRGEDVGPQADLYSFGCMAFHMLAGRPPFTSANLAQIIEQHLTLAPPPLRPASPDVPVELERLVGELLAKAPDDRPASALEVRARLEAIQASLTVSAAPTRVQRALQPAVTRPDLALAVHTDATDQHPALRAEIPTEPERRAVERPTDPDRPSAGARGPVALALVGALALGLLVGAWAILKTDDAVTPPPAEPVAPSVPVKAAVPTPKPPPLTSPEAGPPKPPKAVPPPPTPAPPEPPRGPRHSTADVKRLRMELEQRTGSLSDDLRRAALAQMARAKGCKRAPEACWRILKDVEATYFPK